MKYFALYIFLLSFFPLAYGAKTQGEVMHDMKVKVFKETYLFDNGHKDLYTWNGQVSFELDTAGAYCKFQAIYSDKILQQVGIPFYAHIPKGTKYKIFIDQKNQEDIVYDINFEHFNILAKDKTEIKMSMKFKSHCGKPPVIGWFSRSSKRFYRV